MKKELLLKAIDDGVIKEELAVPILVEHLRAALAWADLSGEEKEAIKVKLDIIIKDTKKHIVLFNRIKKML